MKSSTWLDVCDCAEWLPAILPFDKHPYCAACLKSSNPAVCTMKQMLVHWTTSTVTQTLMQQTTSTMSADAHG